MKTAAVALAAALSGAACAGAHRTPRAAWVEAEGWAPLEAGGEARARRAAVEDALRRAVEGVSGLTLTARVRVVNGISTASTLTTAARARVEAYELIEEGALPGARRARVRARVRAQAPPPPPPPGPVRLVGPEGAARAVGGALAASGWEVGASTAALTLELDARVAGADDPRVRPFRGRRVLLEARARGAAGALLWAGRAEGAGLGGDPAEAEAAALERAAAALARKADEALREAPWNR